jgi:hypothetical protein
MNSPATGILAGVLLSSLLLASALPHPGLGGVAFVVVGTLLCAFLEVPGAQSGPWSCPPCPPSASDGAADGCGLPEQPAQGGED